MSTDTTTEITNDFDFLNGHFDVVHRQLKKPLTGSDEWHEYVGTCNARTHFNGAVSLDEMAFPAQGTYGMSLRLFDPVDKDWTIYWVSSKTGKLQPPVRGRWDGDSCWMVGEDEHDGQPILASYSWSEITERTAKWQQAYSVDGGETWETNWVMEFTRREEKPERLDIPKLTSDFDFLNGHFDVVHRQLKKPLTGSDEWHEYVGTKDARTYFDGAVSVDELTFPDGSYGLSLRLFDPVEKDWTIYWVNSRTGKLQPPVRGRWDGDSCRLVGEDQHDGQPILSSLSWSEITEQTAKWQQAFSIDNGATWETNWVMDFTRREEKPEPPTKLTSDFDFFNGHFDVVHRQLKNPLTGSDEWVEHVGTCTARTHFDGAASVDQVTFPSTGTYGMSLRLFDPVEQDWTIYWVSSRTGKVQPPVRGRWNGDTCRLVGEDVHEGRPILVSYLWSNITEKTARWSQDYSADNGKTWETNWVMDFTRRETEPEPLDVPKRTGDFDFLNGTWHGKHQRLRNPLTGSTEWYELESVNTGWTYHDGSISVDEGVMPSLGFKGLTFRTYDPIAREWSIYWVNSKRGVLDTPVVGKFDAEGNGLFCGPDEHEGVPIEVRFHWRKNGPNPTWEQSFSTDGGKTWETNWRSTFSR